MSKTHIYLFLGAAVAGYFLGATLVQYQPWKAASNLVGNL